MERLCLSTPEDAKINNGPNRRASPHGPGRFGMTLSELAQRAVVGISTIQAIETPAGRKAKSVRHLQLRPLI
jgi:hypothetical protein